MDEKKRKQIEAKLMKLFIQSGHQDADCTTVSGRPAPAVIKVIRRKKFKPDFHPQMD
ncbi:hypothetical protein LJC22_02455 [Desulfosarcina sp. OttesenSCG-928-G10]|nr:hypothetical protein [Desulfosarcina sp. OttesenSCG-928-G10]